MSSERLAGESGISMVETLVGILLLVIGVVASLQLIDTSARTNFRAEERQAAMGVAQRELEEIKRFAYAEIALTGAPTSTDLGGSLTLSDGTLFDDGAAIGPLVVNGGSLESGGQVSGGTVDPEPTPFDTGDVSGKIYRYVTWRDDAACAAESCVGTQDLKRVIVVVEPDATALSGGDPSYSFQTDVSNPASGQNSSAPPESGEIVTAQQFWLSGTPCADQTSDPTRSPASDHQTHDTSGDCASGPKPDALLGQAPPDPTPGDPTDPPLYDYATDIEPGADPTTDKGLQMLVQDAGGSSCDPSPGTSGDPADDPATPAYKEIHRWVSRPMPSEFSITGAATLELWTRTIDDALVSGAICAFISRRTTDGSGNETRTALSPLSVASPTPGFTCTQAGSAARCSSSAWPRGRWHRLRITFGLDPATTLAAGERFELALAIDPEGTPQNALQFMYDDPAYDSRVEIETTTPLG